MHSVITLQDPVAALHNNNSKLDEGQTFTKVSSWSNSVQIACQLSLPCTHFLQRGKVHRADRPQVKAENRTSYWTYQIQANTQSAVGTVLSNSTAPEAKETTDRQTSGQSLQGTLWDATDAIRCAGEESKSVRRAQIGRSAGAALWHGKVQLGGVVRVAARQALGCLRVRVKCATKV